MAELCEGRVVIVTGSGRGIGRAEALELGRQGASVIVCDIGVSLAGAFDPEPVAADVVAEITGAGGAAVSCSHDVGDWEGSRAIVDEAVSQFGRLDAIVNNAGIMRDKMLFNMDESDFDDVVRTHLKGTFNLTRWAAIYWRDRAKRDLGNDARVINTCSPSGLYGSAGQANYSAAKAGIAAMTIGAARELASYGVTVNAISPVAATRMTETLRRPGEQTTSSAPGHFDARDPANVAPVVAWLASSESADVTGQVIEINGGVVGVAEGWRHGPNRDKAARWDAGELGPVLRTLVADSYQVPVPGGGANRRP